MAGEEKICPYLDIPIQHSDDAILRAMHRQGDNQLIRKVIKKARDIVPDIALRTSLITGFPGETPRRFEDLLSFIQEIRFDHLGVFTYSPEEGTPAATLGSRMSEQEKQRRRDILMEAQARISADINSTLIGTRQEVLVEGEGELAGYPRVGNAVARPRKSTVSPTLRGERLKQARWSPAGSPVLMIMIFMRKSSDRQPVSSWMSIQACRVRLFY